MLHHSSVIASLLAQADSRCRGSTKAYVYSLFRRRSRRG